MGEGVFEGTLGVGRYKANGCWRRGVMVGVREWNFRRFQSGLGDDVFLGGEDEPDGSGR